MNTVEYRFHVPAISCGHCVATIERALQPLGVKVQIDLPSKRVRVDAPALLTRTALAQALQKAGYPEQAAP
jgi:copper chaperone